MNDRSRGTARRRFPRQFSLRTLFLAVLLATLILSPIPAIRMHRSKYRRAVQAIRDQGGEVYANGDGSPYAARPESNVQRFFFGDDYSKCPDTVAFYSKESIDSALASLRGLDSLRRLSVVSSTELTDEGMHHVRHLTSLEVLSVACPGVSDSCLTYLAGLSNLRSLCLFDTQVTDAGLRSLVGLQNLEELVIDSSEITDAGLVHLGQLRSLRSLSLENAAISGAGLANLKDLEHLEELRLRNTRLNDDGLRHAAKLVALRIPILDGTEVRGSGLCHLARLAKLNTLGLSSTPIDDQAVAHLRLLTHLHTLDVKGTCITAAGLEELRRSLPNTYVFPFPGE